MARQTLCPPVCPDSFLTVTKHDTDSRVTDTCLLRSLDGDWTETGGVSVSACICWTCYNLRHTELRETAQTAGRAGQPQLQPLTGWVLESGVNTQLWLWDDNMWTTCNFPPGTSNYLICELFLNWYYLCKCWKKQLMVRKYSWEWIL